MTARGQVWRSFTRFIIENNYSFDLVKFYLASRPCLWLSVLLLFLLFIFTPLPIQSTWPGGRPAEDIPDRLSVDF